MQLLHSSAARAILVFLGPQIYFLGRFLLTYPFESLDPFSCPRAVPMEILNYIFFHKGHISEGKTLVHGRRLLKLTIGGMPI